MNKLSQAIFDMAEVAKVRQLNDHEIDILKFTAACLHSKS